MGTVSKEIADRVIAGEFDSDHPIKIVKYNNCFDGSESYGLICEGDPLDKYKETEFVRNPVVYWEK